jgi:hypothetical protein
MEPRRTIEPAESPAPSVGLPGALLGSLGIGLVVLEIGGFVPLWLPVAFATVAALAILGARAFRTDLSIVALFFFVFLDIAALHGGNFPGAYARLPGSPGLRLYLAGALLPQAISNVPAAVLLAPFAGGRFRTLLYAVNAGGCGSIVASLANLLGWQIYRRESGPDREFFRRFTAVNFAFFAGMGILGALLGIT